LLTFIAIFRLPVSFLFIIKGAGVVKVGVWGRCPQASPLGDVRGDISFSQANKEVKEQLQLSI